MSALNTTIFVNAAASFSADWDLKTLIPDANMRRRMSRIVKMGVATAMKCLETAQVKTPEAIVTSTAYGCLADSEKFLAQAIASDEAMLPPTPFIQSTFNTIGSHIAILTNCHEYNMTFVNRQDSFSSALLDACMLIAEGRKNVLLGLADETTPTLEKIIARMGHKAPGLPLSDGAVFFVLSDEKSASTVSEITGLDLNNLKAKASDLMQLAMR